MRTIELWGGPCDGETRTIDDIGSVYRVRVIHGLYNESIPPRLATYRKSTTVQGFTGTNPTRFVYEGEEDDAVGAAGVP